MKILMPLATYIQNLTKKDFERYLILFISGVVLLSGVAVYHVYKKNNNLVARIKRIEKLTTQTEKTINENKKLIVKEAQLQQLLEKNKEFNIKTYFEQFTSQQNITPEPWDTFTIPVEGTDKFDEIVLHANFKNQTTQKLVSVLDALDKQEIIYIKDLSVKNEMNRKITFELTIATKKYKR